MAEKKSLKKNDYRLQWRPFLPQIFLMITATILFMVIAGSIFVLYKSDRPRAQAQKEAVAVAEQYAGLKKTDDFYWYSYDKTYYTVMGTNAKEQKVAVIVPKDGGKITVLKQSEGISEAQAFGIAEKLSEGATVTNASLGIYKDEAAWQVTTKSKSGAVSYYLIAFSDGAQLAAVKDL